jgi:hypothetical protein
MTRTEKAKSRPRHRLDPTPANLTWLPGFVLASSCVDCLHGDGHRQDRRCRSGLAFLLWLTLHDERRAWKVGLECSGSLAPEGVDREQGEVGDSVR